MTHRERIEAVLRGKPVDRVPVAAWGPHLNLEDRNVNDFSKAVIAYEREYEFDVLKVMQNGLYLTEDYGQIIAPPENSDDAGYKKTVKLAFNSVEDWENAEKKDVHQGAYGSEVESIRRICEYFGSDLPVLPTIFGPAQLLVQLSGRNVTAPFYPEGFTGDDLFGFVKQHEEAYFHVMEVLTEQLIDLMNAYLDAGAAGFFYCPGGNRLEFCTDEEYWKYVRPYDERVLNAVKDRAWFTMLHICGPKNLRFRELLDLPVQAINWEDQSPDNPSIAEARKMTDKVLMAGLNRNADFYGADRVKVKSRIRAKAEEAIREGGPKVIVATGCECSREITHRFVVWNEVMDDLAAEAFAK